MTLPTDLIETYPLACGWRIDGQVVAGVDEQQDTLLLLTDVRPYVIARHNTLMVDGQGAAGWVMELTDRRQIYLAVGPAVDAARVPDTDPQTPLSPAIDASVEDAAEPLEAFTQTDVNVSTKPAKAAKPKKVKAVKVKRARWRMSQKAFDTFLFVWPITFFIVMMFWLASLAVGGEASPWGRWPWLNGVIVGFILVGYLGMWWAPPENLNTQDGQANAQDSGASLDPDPAHPRAQEETHSPT